MLDQITLFTLPVLTWDIADSWEWTDAHGVLLEDQDPKVVREWARECPHATSECYDKATDTVRCDCATEIGWTLLNETLARQRMTDQLDNQAESD
jgi:hypothetical protein